MAEEPEQERNLRRLAQGTAVAALLAVGFVCWWLYEGAGYFENEMSFNSAYGPRKNPRVALPAGTVPRDGMGYDAAELDAAPPAALPAAAGAQLYANECAFCHAASGRGDAPVGMEYDPRPPDLNQVAARRTDAALLAAISDGMATPEIDTWPPIGARWHAFRQYLTEAERRALVGYVRREFGAGRQPTQPGATTISQPAYHIVGNPPAKIPHHP